MIDDFDGRFSDAVQAFWTGRSKQQEKQRQTGKSDAGGRGAVTGGGHIDALEELIRDVLVDTGIPSQAIFQNSKLQLPGYYRAEKKWDLLVVAGDTLHIALEFKSQVGPSFGNNFNNRTEEALGNAVDLRRALQERSVGSTVNPPFLGYMFLLDDCPQVHATLGLEEPHFPAEDTFVAKPPGKQQGFSKMLRSGVGYAMRYELFLERLLSENLYNAACLTLTTKAVPTLISFPNDNLHIKQFIGRLVGFASGIVAAGFPQGDLFSPPRFE